MINTYRTSMAPPPVPPRDSRSQPILIPATLPSPGYSRPLIRFLLGMVMLHFVLSVGGFIFLYFYNEKPVLPAFSFVFPAGSLPWKKSHSIYKNINTFGNSWVTILEPGNYYVYSRVTFSKGDAEVPLVSWVMLRKTKTTEEKVVMKAYCSLNSFRPESNPHMCTATQGDVITLETGNQLSVYVQDLSLIDYEEGATTFGMYKL
ncbi:CD40 ligand [Xenentodon cancila]